MATATASVRTIRLSPRKTRLVADLIRGKKVADARDILAYMPQASAPVIKKILESAVANAENAAAETRERIDTDEMIVATIMVNEGQTIKRFRPRARGSASPIRKRTSHIELTITDKRGG